MMAPLSVVIPTLQAADRIGPCLGALGEALMEGVIHEVIIADGGSTDGIADIAEAVGARVVTASPGRGNQLAAGAEAARGRWLLFLHADTVLSPGWGAAVLTHIQTRPGQAGYFALQFDTRGAAPRFVAGWANFRAALFALPYGDQGLLVSRLLYDQAGGYPDIPLMEDVALVRRIGRRRLTRLGADAVTSAARYGADGWLRRGWRNLTTLALYFLGTSPQRLARRYVRSR
ncbi:MAG TPA: TIGR04283 family arsenosugar biosynthesis glycosyltransferase [Thermohalobaculum sp.]|nr:TIGR04283 family arsenosugar biosynthesis glycosyltransferase [Thermohalobaculum sp.]